MEGRFLGLPAIAMSLVTADHKAGHFETAARAAVEIIARLMIDPLPADTILNVNVPDLPWDEVRGFEVTRLGHRHRSEPASPQADPRGRPIWWIGPAGPEQDAGPGTDFHAVRTGFISITPIHVDLTRYQALEKVASWVGGLALRWRHPHDAAIARLQPEVAGQGMTSQRARDRMVERLRSEGGIRDERVLNAMRTVPRHLFVDEALAMRAYDDTALPIGNGQTISQPYVVAIHDRALLNLQPEARAGDRHRLGLPGRGAG